MLMRCITAALVALSAGIASAAPMLSTGGFQIRDSDGLQDIVRQASFSLRTGTDVNGKVTWDEKSIVVRGERILFYSGEFHPFRLPVPDLWLDVFQKIKALGYSGVSFYVDWALLEGQRGTFRADGVFALEPFFDAAAEAGIYLLARPGPYINAEVSGGGFPGWLTRVNGTFRTNDTGFLEATDLYAASVGAIIAKAQITNGGPVILFQPENEYTNPQNNITFPNSVSTLSPLDYMQLICFAGLLQLRDEPVQTGRHCSPNDQQRCLPQGYLRPRQRNSHRPRRHLRSRQLPPRLQLRATLQLERHDSDQFPPIASATESKYSLLHHRVPRRQF